MAVDDKSASPPAGLSDRFLSFRVGSRDYAIPLEHVSGLADCGPIRTVDGVPPEVLGLSEWRGRLLTVLDLHGLLGEPHSRGTMCLIRLSGTMTHTALRVAAPVTLVTADDSRSEGGFEADRDHFIMVDPTELVLQLEAEILSGSPGGEN